jgi:hypothetical protein
MPSNQSTLKHLLIREGSILATQERILEQTGVNIPYTTLNHWSNGRFDIEGIRRAIAIKQFFNLTDEELLQVLENSHQDNKSR